MLGAYLIVYAVKEWGRRRRRGGKGKRREGGKKEKKFDSFSFFSHYRSCVNSKWLPSPGL